jgi:hypothetical protein
MRGALISSGTSGRSERGETFASHSWDSSHTYLSEGRIRPVLRLPGRLAPLLLRPVCSRRGRAERAPTFPLRIPGSLRNACP